MRTTFIAIQHHANRCVYVEGWSPDACIHQNARLWSILLAKPNTIRYVRSR